MEKQLRREQGMDEETSHRDTHVAFGGVERYKEQVRQARVLSWLDDLMADVRFSFRSIVRYRAFALAVIVTLALGIGGTTGEGWEWKVSLNTALSLRARSSVSSSTAVGSSCVLVNT